LHSPTAILLAFAKKYSSIELEAHMLFPIKPPAATITFA